MSHTSDWSQYLAAIDSTDKKQDSLPDSMLVGVPNNSFLLAEVAENPHCSVVDGGVVRGDMSELWS